MNITPRIGSHSKHHGQAGVNESAHTIEAGAAGHVIEAPAVFARDVTIRSPSGREIVSSLSFSVQQGMKLAILGVEGAGKSTLLKALAGELPSSFEMIGEVVRGKVGYLPQRIHPAWLDSTVTEFLLAAAPHEDIPFERWNDSANVLRELSSVSLPADLFYQDRRLSTLSGGELVRLQLAQILSKNPQCLLLDEPSNHLDIRTIEWLERFLKDERRPVVFVSHDEVLIERVSTAILYLQHVPHRDQTIATFSGESYAQFVESRRATIARSIQSVEAREKAERALKRQLSEATSKSERRERNSDANDMATKNRAERGATRALRHIAQLKERLEQSDPIESLEFEESAKLTFLPEASIPNGRIIATIQLPRLAVGDRTLAKNVRLDLVGRSRIFITGDNGAGKTTLLRKVKTELDHKEGIRVAYLPQRYDEILKNSQSSPIDILREVHSDEQFCRLVLARLGLSRLEAATAVGQLSGGQRAKTILGRAICSGANVLLLDEPTTNLSPLLLPVLISAIRDFPGAVVAVSHDRRFISSVASRILELTPDGLSDVNWTAKHG